MTTYTHSLFLRLFVLRECVTACNDVSETHAKSTTYDNVFFFRTIVDEIVRARSVISRKKNVTSGEVRACWKNVSL